MKSNYAFIVSSNRLNSASVCHNSNDASWTCNFHKLDHRSVSEMSEQIMEGAFSMILTFSCQLNSTLMACPPPSLPKFRPPICENPVAVGDIALDDDPCDDCAIPLYMYFMSVSSTSEPPSDLYILSNMGVMSAWRMDWRISITVAR